MAPERPPNKTGSFLTIRPAAAGDAESIAVIYNESVRSSTATFDTVERSVAAQLSWLEDHDAQHPVLVADLDGTVTGWASLSPWSDRSAYDGTVETSVYVGAPWKGRGIGRRLLSEILEVGARHGFHTILARIAEGNPVSTQLHLSAGFTSVGVMHQVGFKFGRFLDVELFELSLSGRVRPP
jgi:L-amino acid N-acyltransferase